MPVGVTTAVTAALTSIGIGATTASFIAPALIGAGVGAGGAALLGKDPGKGALFGGLTGGALGFGPSLGAELGIGTVGADVLLGAAAGTVGGALTGGNIGKSALFGGAAGLTTGLLTPAAGAGAGDLANPSSAAPSTSGASGIGQAGATAVAQGGIPDLTAPGAASIGGGANPIAAGAGAGVAGPAMETINITAPGAGAGAGAGNIGAIGGGAAVAATGQTRDSISGMSVDHLGRAPDALSTPMRGASGVAPGQEGAAPAGGAGAGQGTTVGTFMKDPSMAHFGNILSANPATTIGALGLAYQGLTQPKTPNTSEITGSLKTQADQLAEQGNAFRSFLNTGSLPPGAMAAVNNASNSAKATLKSRYAALGLSGSTSEATALANVDQQVAGQIFEIANSLLQTGIKESGLSAEIYKAILAQSNSEDATMSSAISNFAASIAGGGNRNVGATG